MRFRFSPSLPPLPYSDAPNVVTCIQVPILSLSLCVCGSDPSVSVLPVLTSLSMLLPVFSSSVMWYSCHLVLLFPPLLSSCLLSAFSASPFCFSPLPLLFCFSPLLLSPLAACDGPTIPRDWAVARWLCSEVGVSCIPLSIFYTEQNKNLAANYVRFTFGKAAGNMDKVKERLMANKHVLAPDA